MELSERLPILRILSSVFVEQENGKDIDASIRAARE